MPWSVKTRLKYWSFIFQRFSGLSLLCSTVIFPKILPSLSNLPASFSKVSQRPEKNTDRRNNLRDRQRWQENRNRIQFYPLEMKVIISHCLSNFEFLINCFSAGVKIFSKRKNIVNGFLKFLRTKGDKIDCDISELRLFVWFFIPRGKQIKNSLSAAKDHTRSATISSLQKKIITWVRSEAGFLIKLCKQNKPHLAWRVFLEVTACLFTTIRFLSQQIFTSHAVISERDDKGTWRGKNDPFVKRSSGISIFALFFYSNFFYATIAQAM